MKRRMAEGRDKGPTVGRRYPDLATYIAESGDTQQHIAARVGASQAHVSRIAAGEIVPRPFLAARLAEYAKVPLDSFTRVYLANRHAAAE
jgi:transcriptional regulator with XRE-family HTH domain